MLQQKKSVKTAGIALLLITVLFFLFAGCGSESKGKAESKIDGETEGETEGETAGEGEGEEVLLSDDEFKAGLDGLKVNYKPIIDAPLKDVNGNELPENYNPLSGSTFAVYKVPEIYMTGNSIENTVMPNAGIINPDNFSVIASDGTDLTEEGHDTITKCEAGDTDKNGIDEVITAVFDMTAGSFNLRETKKNKESGEYSFTDILTNNDATITPENIDIYRTCLELADVDGDGDGKDEILIAYNNTLIIYDDKIANYAQLVKKTFATLVSGSAQYLRVRCGNFDYDAAKEIVVTNGSASITAKAEYFVYDDLAVNTQMSELMDATGASGKLNMIRAANLVIGDYNGDRLEDIAFSGLLNDYAYSNYNGNLVYYAGMTLDKNSKPVFTVSDFPYSRTIDSDSIMESMAAGKIFAYDDYQGFVVGGKCFFSRWYEATVSGYLASAVFDGIRIGDIDGDETDEIVAYVEGNINYLVITEATNSSFPQPVVTQKYLSDTEAVGAICLPCTMPLNRPEKHSTVMEFLKHEILLTEPKILAVIASPPYWEGINQAEGSTSYGESTSSGSSESSKIGFSAYQALGFEAGIDGAFKVKMVAKIEAGFDYSSSQTTEITESVSRTTVSGEDMVVFTCIPYDVYYYKIISTNDPNSKIGSIVTVNTPRIPITIPTEVDFFNENNGLFEDIGTDILCHTKGNPRSYASYETISAQIVASGYYTPLVRGKNVGQGSGTTTLSMEETKTSEQNYEMSLQVGYDGEVNISGISIGGGSELHGGYSYSISCSNSTTIEGTVGNISAEDFSTNLAFSWGLTSWFYENESGLQKFPVTTYWVK